MSEITTIAIIQVGPEPRRRIRMAAAVAGLTVKEFIKRAALDRAEELLRGFECGPDLVRELDPEGLTRYKAAVSEPEVIDA